MKSLVYLIKWRECLNGVKEASANVMHLSGEGALIETDDDTAFLDYAINEGCTAYARYYRLRIIKAGDLEKARSTIRPLDIWVDGDVLNIVVNPLRLSTLDIARALYGSGFELELVSEDDVEYMR